MSLNQNKNKNTNQNENTNQNQTQNQNIIQNNNKCKSLSGTKRSYVDVDDLSEKPPLKKQKRMIESDNKFKNVIQHILYDSLDPLICQLDKEIQAYKDQIKQLEVEKMKTKSKCKYMARQMTKYNKTIQKQAKKIKELQKMINIKGEHK